MPVLYGNYSLVRTQACLLIKGGIEMIISKYGKSLTVVDRQEISNALLDIFLEDARKTFSRTNRFCAAITPEVPVSFIEDLGDKFKASLLPAERVHIFFTDTRCCLS